MNVVLVESSNVVSRIIGRVIEARGDHLHRVATGAEALDYLARHDEIDLVITRLILPDMDGVELCWLARAALPMFSTVQIVAMTSNDDKRRLGEALDAGADDYLELPFGEAELVARLRSSERALVTQREIARMATTDELTGILNRRAFLLEVEASIANMALEVPTSLAVLDIDHFKRVNDTYGHDVGDAALRAVCNSFAEREGVLGRLGGEEFAWLLPGFEMLSAINACQSARVAISELRIPAGKATLSVTCSFGLTDCYPGETTNDVLKRADIAVYEAKEAGRDRVMVRAREEAPDDVLV